MWFLYKSATCLKTHRFLVCWIILFCLGFCACQTQPSTTQQLATQTTTEVASPGPSDSTMPEPTPTLSPEASATSTNIPIQSNSVNPTPSPSPTLIGPQLVLNSGFDDGIQHWEQPYGVLKHNTSDFHTGPGAAHLITNSSTGFLDYRGSMGQCIALQSFLTEWQEIEGQFYMVLEAYLRSDQGITNVSLNGIFLDDPQCGTGQVGFFVIPSLAGNQPWTRVTGNSLIPAEAQSLHLFVNANGVTESASVYIDDVRAYSAEPPTN